MPRYRVVVGVSRVETWEVGAPSRVGAEQNYRAAGTLLGVDQERSEILETARRPDSDPVARAREFLVAYRQAQNLGKQGWEEVLAWIITDLRHFCDQESLDYHHAEHRSYHYYLEERAHERQVRQAQATHDTEADDAPPA